MAYADPAAKRANAKDRYYRDGGRERQYDWNRAHVARQREWMDSLKSAPCNCCGVAYHPRVMDWHHRDASTKSFSLRRFQRYSRAAVLAEIEKCVLLCANCHRLVEADLLAV